MRRAAVAACFVVLLAACSGAQHTSAGQVDAYLVDARAASQTATILPSGQLLDLGRGMCAEYGKGKHFDDIIEANGAERLPPDLWSAVLVAATSDLCPQYRKRARRDVGL